ncbi:DUF2169 domain-containing protein [Sorangium atrum]|uniref:DUF2169 domain-containing protein n=1 Tax=Sorangium atrum TaxID=2995308 RepID=A0ABT5BSN2_9BACT|nr:DUF2169 domain-containing protein [Sorangium aterium]MDC0677169.1 DUF2169 domain-containing protein [Sorangium aterium]
MTRASMSAPSPRVAVTPLGPSAAATVCFRLRGRLHVTVVVKATFALVPEGRMSLVAPDPIAAEEQPDPSGQRLQVASDLAPYLDPCGVVVTGHAELPPGFSSPHAMVRLTVVQDGQLRIDKQAQLDGSARVGPARSHVRIDGLGPLPRTSPLRSRLLGAVDARRVHGALLDIPEGLDWSYFQAAPMDQRIPALRGDEWIVLGGMMAQRPKLRTQLPEARGVARLYRQKLASPRAGEPISLRADTAHIDVDRRRCSVVWRGHAPVEEAEIESLRVLAGVELPGQPIAWADPFAAGGASAAPSGSASQQNPKAITLDGTSQLSPEDAARLVAAVATPFSATRGLSEPARSVTPAASQPTVAPRAAAAPPARPGGVRDLLGETDALDPEDAARVVAAGAMPFSTTGLPSEPMRSATLSTSQPAVAPRAAAIAPARPGGVRDLLEETTSLDPEDAARAVTSVAMPFDARRTPSEPAGSAAPTAPLAAAPRAAAAPTVRRGGVRDLLEETTSLDPEDAARAIASATTPFDARRAPVAAPSEPPRQAASSSAPPAPPSLLSPAPLVTAQVHVAPPIVRPPGPGDARALPEGLGAQFLAAMADAGLLHG